jgi:uncharacterized protein YbjT (DUF2867 family)
MYAITGITGKVGGAAARSLLAESLPVRAVLRDEAKAAWWRTRGCDVGLAEMDDAASLTSAFRGAAGVFILPPSEFDPEPGFPEAKRVIAAVTTALAEARPGKLVCLSTIGADAPHENLLTQRTLMEQSLQEIGLPITFLRPGWFMENALWDIPSARDEGVLRSFLQPADKLFPMVATQDVGGLAATLLRENGSGTRVVELEGPARISPNDLARAFATVLKRTVRVETVPRESWEQIFRSQGPAALPARCSRCAPRLGEIECSYSTIVGRCPAMPTSEMGQGPKVSAGANLVWSGRIEARSGLRMMPTVGIEVRRAQL